MARLPDSVVAERRAEARRLSAQGLTTRQIGARMGIHHSTAAEMINDEARARHNAHRLAYHHAHRTELVEARREWGRRRKAAA